MTKFTFTLIAVIALSTTVAFGGEWIIFSDELPPGADLALHGNSQFVVSNSNPYQGANHLKRDFATSGDWGWITGVMSLNLDLSSIDFDTAYIEFYIDGGTNAIGYLELRLGGAAWDPDFQNTGVTVDDQPGYELVKVMLKDFTGTGGGASPTNLDEFTGGTGMIDRISWGFGAAGDLFIDEVRILDAAGGVTAIASNASNPGPAHGEADVSRDVTLGWKPGEFANTHDVYLGTALDDVNDASSANPMDVLASSGQDANSFDPGGLTFGQTYYWRVDEVNSAPDFAVFTGDVWSFTTEPVGYPIANVTATASSSNNADQGPKNTINSSGLDADDLHSDDDKDMWLSSWDGPQPTWVQYEFDIVYKLHEMWVWNHNSSVEPLVGFGIREAVIEYSTDGTKWTTLGSTHEFTQAPGGPGYAHNTTVDLNGVSAKYVRFTANSNWNLGGWISQYGLSEVRFFSLPVLAREPSPASGATDVGVDSPLAWRSGREADRHEVYLSTDEQAVIDGTAAAVTVTEPSHAPSLDLASTYFWRIDEVNDAETPTTWQGDVWDFATQEFIVVEDFESYNDIPVGEEGSNFVYDTWADGFEIPTNGSTMGYAVPFEPTMETDTVHGGSQSAPMAYDNTAAAMSEVTRTLDAQNWTVHGIQTLSLWFFGDPTNKPGQLYAKINGVQVNYDGDSANLSRPLWHRWDIDLTTVGTNLQSVTSLAIGVQGFGATGTLLLDDIGLYGSVPAPAEEIWLEAEAAASVTPPMTISSDPLASGGGYIGTQDGVTGNEMDAAPADGIATYSFTVQGGVYKIAGRVIIPGGDSFWVRIPGATDLTPGEDPDQPGTGWVRWSDPSDGDQWHWEDVFSADHGGETANWTLPAGTYTLEIARREDGALLDAILITSDVE